MRVRKEILGYYENLTTSADDRGDQQAPGTRQTPGSRISALRQLPSYVPWIAGKPDLPLKSPATH